MTVDDVACPKCGAEAEDIYGVEVRGVYDGILYWECRDCLSKWPRHPFGSRLYDRAVEAITDSGWVWGEA